MRSIISHIPLTACAVATALLVSACGGGDASAPPVVIGSSGFAVDDYIKGANVVCDTNANGMSDAGEATTTTDSSGFFEFSTACTASLVLTGGTNIDTNLPFVGKLKSPAGSTMVTPLTTLMAEGMTLDQINAALGLPAGTNVATEDPARKVGGDLLNADLFRTTLAVQQILQKIAETLAALAGSTDVAGMYSQAAAAMAEVLRGGSSLITGNTVNQATVAAVLQAAATRVGADVNAASLAEVVAGAITVQANLILAAENPQAITDTTKAQQGSSVIQTFVLANEAALQAAPSGATASLAAALIELVSGGTPPPPDSGTLLLSFDEANPVFVDMGAYGGALPEVVAGPAGGSGSALKIAKPAGQMAWGGVYFGLPSIPFTADRKVLTAKVYSTRANAVIKFKVEVAGGVSTEVASAPVPANTWTTVSWDMTGIDLSKSYTVIAITPDQEVTTSGQSYYIDNITLAPAVVVPPAGCATSTHQCISFSESTIAALGFEKLVSAGVANDPVAGASNPVLKMVKGPSGEDWAGATVYTMGTVSNDPAVRSVLTIDAVGLNTSKTVTLRSYSAAPVGTKITLKLENGIDPGQNIAAETVTTQQNAWETLTFNFANLTTGVFSSSTTYNTASIFPSFSINGPYSKLAEDTTFYFDELKYAIAGSTPPPPTGCGTTEPTCAPTTTIPSGSVVIYSDAVSAGNLDAYPNWQQTTQFSEATIASNKSLKYTNLNYQGIQFDVVNVTTKGKLHLDFWTPNVTSVKVSIISPGKENAYTQVLTTGGWNSVDIDLSNYTVPDLSGIYQIKLEGIPTGGTLYVDNIYFWGTAGGGGGGGASLTYASNYTESPTPWKSTQGGDAGRYVADGALDWWSGLASGDTTPSFYFGYGLLPTDWGFGAYVNAPSNGTAIVTSYSNVQISVWGNDQLVNQSPRPNFNLIMQAPAVAGGCIPEVQKEFQVTGGGVQTYTIALSGMVVRKDCGQPTLNTAAAILATGVKSVHVQVTTANLNKTAGVDAATGRYPNGLNVGPISFN
jgi:hypothetical protein